MFRWQAIVVAAAVLASAGPVHGQRLRERFSATTAPVAPVANQAGGDWSTGYTVDFGYANAKRPAAAAAAPTATSVAAAPASAARPAPPPGRLHVLLLVDDTDKENGATNKAGAAAIERAIRAGVAPERLAGIEVLSSAELTPEKVRARITGLSLRPQDTLVAYYSGPIDYDDRVRWYTLTPAGGRIARSDLRDWLFARGAALTVLLTDAPLYRIVPETLPDFHPSTGPGSLHPLFFSNRGVVDVHANALGEVAFGRDGEGGIFTLSLADQLGRLKGDGPPGDWPAFVDRVRDETNRLFGDYRRAVLVSDKLPPDDKRVVRDQARQSPTALTPIARATPAPEPVALQPKTPQSAEIVVYLPAEAKVFIEDRPTTSTGPERHFETDPLQPGRTYTYTLRVEMPDDSESDDPQTKRITVRAGETVEVRFNRGD
jgi:uncharacterized protein (TIGR03000 family)